MQFLRIFREINQFFLIFPPSKIRVDVKSVVDVIRKKVAQGGRYRGVDVKFDDLL